MQRVIVFIFFYMVVFIQAKSKTNQISTARTSCSNPLSKFNQSARARQLHLVRVFRYLKIRGNSIVADIGAGSGWLTFGLAQVVGPKGKVYAVDLIPQGISSIQKSIKTLKLNNIEAILGLTTDPKLPKNTLDAAMILIAYHEFEKPFTMLKKIRQAMKTNARLGIIERDNDQMRADAREMYANTGFIPDRVNETMPDHFLVTKHIIALDIVMREVTSIGFKFVFSRELDDDYYIAVFVNPR